MFSQFLSFSNIDKRCCSGYPVIDDGRFYTDATVSFLRQFGYRAYGAYSWREADAIIGTGVDLVILGSMGQSDQSAILEERITRSVKGVIFSLLTGSLLGSIVGVLIMLITQKDMKLAIPFGPFLSIGAITYVFGAPDNLFIL